MGRRSTASTGRARELCATAAVDRDAAAGRRPRGTDSTLERRGGGAFSEPVGSGAGVLLDGGGGGDRPLDRLVDLVPSGIAPHPRARLCERCFDGAEARERRRDDL